MSHPSASTDPVEATAPDLDLPGSSSSAALIAYGRVGWPEVARMLAGAEAAWAGYDGFHVGPPPLSPPPYSHVWAWTAEWVARIRVEGQAAIVGVLALRASPASPPPEQWRREVGYREIRAQTWPPTEKRVGPLLPGVAGRVADLYVVSDEHPVTFVRIRAETGI